MIPFPGTPAAERLSAKISRLDTIIAIDQLQQALHGHGVYTSLAYEEGQPCLHVRNDLTIWADPHGQTFFWSTCHGERAERGPVAELERVARRIAERFAVPPFVAGSAR